MNRKTAFAALILCLSFTLTACTLLNDSSSSQAVDEQNTSSTLDEPETTDSSSSSETADITSESETADSNSNAEGGNPDIADYIDVTVSEDKYFYENHEISYDDLVKVFDGLGGNTAVRISDENATLKAYESLTTALEERGIMFETAG